ncbi:unnamed protein product [Heligmosomoides polygyrus]|uniref:DUF834 domain-containing protein n=1 Tax=Heligmosomoides polygyrus TaxID=6339 RepID=A0A183F5S3_HELPZ|nr:unnamed protein product [Heligmosomoides polygyrus]
MERTSQPSTRPPSAKQRAKSLPRRPVERDPFEGLEGGWWSKGEVLRNKERRELANSGKSVAGGDWSQRPETPKRQHVVRRVGALEREDDLDNVPAAGYSGHMPGLRQVGIGKSFNIAAREAKRDQALRRRANSGGRGLSCISLNPRSRGSQWDTAQHAFGGLVRTRCFRSQWIGAQLGRGLTHVKEVVGLVPLRCCIFCISTDWLRFGRF